MASLGTVGVDFEARTRSFNRALDNMTRRMNRLSADTRRTQSSVSTSTIAIGNAWAMAAEKAVGATTKIINSTVEIVKESAMMAIQFENNMMQVEKIFGSASDSITMFADNQARALGMSTSDAIEFSRIYGRMTTNIIGNQAESAKITQQLLKQSAVVASATGRSMDDVMTRITSGLRGETEAIEDLGIEVTASMLKSTKAFRKFAGDRSWNKLDDATKKQIRLFGILEQSMEIGTSVQNTNSAALQRLSATFKDASLNLGQSFMPIIEKAIPLLQRFADTVLDVTIGMKQFSEIIFDVKEKENDMSKSSDKASKSQEDLSKNIKKAAVNAQKSLAPFDKLNNMQEQLAKTGDDKKGDGKGDGKDGLDEDFIRSLPRPMTSGEIRTEAVKQYAKELGFVVKDITTIVSNIGKAYDTLNKPIKVGEGFFATLKTQTTEAKNDLFGLKNGLNAIDTQTQKSLNNINMKYDTFFTGLQQKPWSSVKMNWWEGMQNTKKQMDKVLTRMSQSVDKTVDNIKDTDWEPTKLAWGSAFEGVKNRVDGYLGGIETSVNNTTNNVLNQVNSMKMALESVGGAGGFPAMVSPSNFTPISSFSDVAETKFTTFTPSQQAEQSTGLNANSQNFTPAEQMQPINLTVVTKVGETELARTLIGPLNKESQRIGNNLIIGGQNPSPYLK